MNKFSEKYLKYKFKYLNLKKHFGGSDNEESESEEKLEHCNKDSAACICKKCLNKATERECGDGCTCDTCKAELAKAVEDSPLPILQPIVNAESKLEQMGPDTFSVILQMLKSDEQMNLFQVSTKIQNQFRFDVLLGMLDRKFDFSGIPELMISDYMTEKCVKILDGTKQYHCKLFLNKIKLISLYIKFNDIKGTVDSIDGFVFSEAVLIDILKKSIFYTYVAKDTEEKIHEYQDYLYSFLSVPNKKACKRLDTGRYKPIIVKNITIPRYVTRIGAYAFSNFRLTKVTIPISVKHIGDVAFGDNNLTEVTIPISVKSIGIGAFQNNNLTKVTIPNSVKHIGGNAFRNNKLTEVTIPDSVEHIGDRAFYSNKLTEVIIPRYVQKIGYGAFFKNEITKISASEEFISEIGRYVDMKYIKI